MAWKIEKNVLRARPNNSLDYVCTYLILEQDTRVADFELKEGKVEASGLALNAAADVECFYCHQKGHFKSKCLKRKADLRKRNKNRRPKEAHYALATVGVGSWVLDSGASVHLTGSLELLHSTEAASGDTINIPDGKAMATTVKGTVTLRLRNGLIVDVNNVHHIPGLVVNLLSVSQLMESEAQVIFKKDRVLVTKNGTVILQADLINGVYVVQVDPSSQKSCFLGLYLWHERLAHPAIEVVKKTLLQCGVCIHMRAAPLMPYACSHGYIMYVV